MPVVLSKKSSKNIADKEYSIEFRLFKKIVFEYDLKKYKILYFYSVQQNVVESDHQKHACHWYHLITETSS